MPLLLLVRHGRTTANTSGLLAGWTPGVALDDRGVQQAEALAERLAGLPISRVITSPLQRCRQTAQIVAPEVTAEPVDDLGECHYGSWTGQPMKDLTGDPLWKTVQRQPSAVTFPPGEYANESISAMQSRAVAACRRLDAEVEGEHGPKSIWMVVSHGDVIKSVLADAVGSHLDQFQRIVVGPASLSAISYAGDRPYVLRMNDNGSDVSDLAAIGGDAVVGGSTGTPEDETTGQAQPKPDEAE